jgi:CheY-like chemotaxis protein
MGNESSDMGLAKPNLECWVVQVMRSEMIGLVVEDEWLLRLELVQELVNAGYRVEEAGSGEEALAMLAAGTRLDFLVTDIRLNGPVDGWQVAEAARAAYPGLGVVYVSANPVVEGRRVPGSVFLGKPCDIAALLRACNALTP